MKHFHCRIPAILLLALMLQPLGLELGGWTVLLRSHSSVALAQAFPDPGFGDPTTLTQTPMLPANLPPAPAFVPNVYAPTGPMAPNDPVRPQGWPGGSPQPYGPPPANNTPPQANASYRMATASPPLATTAKKSPSDPPYDPAEILARVGSERIQACEMLPMVNRAIYTAVKDQPAFHHLPPEQQQEEIQKAQRVFVEQAIKELIKTKLVVADLRGTAAAKPLAENEKKIRDFFNAEYIKHLQEEYEASSIPDLENRLRAMGGSIESQRTLFIEQNLASGWLNQAAKKDDQKEPTHDEMLEYYRAHTSEWETPARVKWEQLTATFSNFNSKQEARAALARWGNDVIVRRVPFAEVAKAHSQEYAADEGGLHDWATKGSLRSVALDQALFSPNLPVGTMSQIIEDDEGFHIVRVLERDETVRAPFVEVQPEIRKKLEEGGQGQQKSDYIEELRKRTPVWTVFDDSNNAGDTVQR